MFANEPCVHVTAGPIVTPTLSVAVTVTAAVAPDNKERIPGLKVITGGVVSLATVIVSVAVLPLPAASVAVAVHVVVVSTLTTGAV